MWLPLSGSIKLRMLHKLPHRNWEERLRAIYRRNGNSSSLQGYPLHWKARYMVIYGMNGNGSALQRGLLLLHPLNRKVLRL